MIDAWLTQKKVTEKKIRYNPYEVYSNCITKIPRNIKLELSGKVLTLKSGSTCVQYGSTYQTITSTNDLTRDFSNIPSTYYDKKLVIFPNKTLTYIGYLKIDNISSGSSLPTGLGTGQLGFYNTTDKILYETSDGGTTWIARNSTYPIALIDVDSVGNISFAKDSNGNDMIFNGAGFIGHHSFVYPNIMVLVPNGFNEDGSLKSSIQTIGSLQIRELSAGQSFVGLNKRLSLNTGWAAYKEVENYSDADFSKKWLRYYVKNNNNIYVSNGNTVIRENSTPFVEYTYDGTIVTDFTIRQPYEGAAVQTLYEPEEYEVEYDRTFFNLEDTVVFKAKNILETQEQSLAYEPNLGIDLKRFLDPDVKIQNRTFEAYSIQKLSEQGINTIELLSDKETFRQLFDYKVAETDNEGMIAQ